MARSTDREQQQGHGEVKMGLEFGNFGKEEKCAWCGKSIKGSNGISDNGNHYCSQGCYHSACQVRLKGAKEAGKETLKKWGKELEKFQQRISNLEDALEGSSADKIYTAINGGNWAMFKRSLRFIFLLPSYIFWPVAIIGFGCVLYKIYKQSAANINSPAVVESTNVTAPVTNVTVPVSSDPTDLESTNDTTAVSLDPASSAQ